MNRTIKRHGEEVTVVRYVEDGFDDYGDVNYEQVTETTKGLVQRTGQSKDPFIDASGQDANANTYIYVSDSVEVNGPMNDKKPSVIRRNLTGNEFRVENEFPEGNGIRICECARIS